MVEALARIPDDPDNNYFMSPALREEWQESIERLRASGATEKLVPALSRAAEFDLRMGEVRRAIALWTEAVGLVDAHAGALPPRMRPSLDFLLGLAYMRLGETENCCLRWTPESCILPIRGGGIHERREGSEHAFACFERVVRALPERDPLHRTAAWMMNIAAMTLGEYPDRVPEPQRIAPEAFAADEPFPHLENVAHRLGIDTFSLSGGAAADDFDGDGDLDLVVSSWDPAAQIRVWKNEGDGTFRDDTERAGVIGITGGLNLVHADYDNDGDLDIYVLRGAWIGGCHPNSLLRNRGDGSFVDVTFAVGLGERHFPTQTAAWADYDLDGDLDLYVGNESTGSMRAPGQLFRNDGARGFVDVARAAGVENYRFAKAVTWGDFDDDRYPDLFISNHENENRLYRNRGDGTFEDVAPRLGVLMPVVSFPAWFWDYDNDGRLDILVNSYAPATAEIDDYYRGKEVATEPTRLYHATGLGGFADVAKQVGLDRPAMPMGSNFGDFDGDGWLDVYLGTGAPPYYCIMPNLLLMNRKGERFADVTTAAGVGHLQKGHGVVFADFDGDGDLDLFEEMGGAYPGDGFADALYVNPGFGNHWISVELRGRRTNRFGLGARIRVVTTEGGARRSIYRHVNTGGSFGSNPFRQLIGLGRAERIESLEVFWPTTGETQRFAAVALDRAYRVDEGAGEIEERTLPRFRLGDAPRSK